MSTTVDVPTIKCIVVYMNEPTLEQLASRRRLDDVGSDLRSAREALAAAMEAARVQALDCIARGVPETVIATELGVDRMTVRKWAGKR
jgi:FixJ family two-component response regulator